MIRAHVGDDVYGFSVKVAIVLEPEEDGAPPLIMRLGDGMCTAWEPVEEGVVTSPTLSLDPETARALMQGLLDHFHRGQDTRALRQDYQGICVRLDKLSEAVAALRDDG
jgi:hypothetical protein